MALFFSRRTYNAQTQKFTNNPAALTRYVSISDPGAGGTRKGGIVSRENWLDLVGQEGAANGVLVFVHGFNTSQADMLNRLAKIKAGVAAHGFRGAVVAFDWPSDGAVHAYDRDRSDAKTVAPHLVGDGIVPLLGMSPRPRIHILAHSMGGLVVLRALSDFGDSAGPTRANWGADEILFASADVDAAWLERGAWGGLVLKARAKRFTNYYCGRDRVLDLSGNVINGGRERVGRVGMPAPRTGGHWDLYANEQYLRDVPDAQRTMTYSHTWWFDNDGFYKDVALTLAGENAETMPTRRRTNIDDLALLT
ncbi:alpha/beta fold hydrolase [Chachezhania sediminis]|uniref:alpha/beta fold hydrolase n=1 Tax=Chachezhania sediminis TaxID=2599291 RepID=UPI00131DE75E|nr:alpha/beta fold hydrolase [Chachezhania sediminis]